MILRELTEKRKRWVDANRENGFEDGIKRLLTDLYPDNAHFIYEILQNAEDVGAHVISFILSKTNIEVEHDSKKLFDINNVDAITGIGVSTKRDDKTAIGKFGVGFKAVFAYTNTPEIHSGDFHFRITNLVVPESINNASHFSKTRFTFPFDNPNKPESKAIYEIEKELRSLDDSALLFLSDIEKIEYLLPDGQTFGSVERKEIKDGIIEINTVTPNGDSQASYWLTYKDKVAVTDEKGQSGEYNIGIAYQLEKTSDEDKVKHLTGWNIVAPQTGRVCIYFPAEKETSKLKFHINAPFASTVARDSVRECEENDQLRDAIAELVVKSLSDIRKRNLLTMNFLSILPIPGDELSDYYEPIRKAIIKAFKEQALTPTKSGEYAPADALYRGPADISSLFSDDDLLLFTGFKTPLWAANAPQINQRDDKFLESLGIDKWSWGELYKLFHPNNKDETNKLENWIKRKDNAWLQRLYALLNELPIQYQKRPESAWLRIDYKAHGIVNRELKIVKCYSENGGVFVKPEEAYFGPKDIDDLPRDVNFIIPETYSSGRSEGQKTSAKNFLMAMDIREYDEKAIIERKLKRYTIRPVLVTEKENISDIKHFLRYWKNNPNNVSGFKGYSFIIGLGNDGKQCFRNPNSYFIDTPYKETGLSQLKDIHGGYELWSGYKEKLPKNQLDDFVEFLIKLGVFHCLIVENTHVSNNENWNKLFQPGRQTDTGTAIDFSIDDLSEYILKQSIIASRLIWEAIIKADKKVITAAFSPNQQYHVKTADSQLVCILKKEAWIPGKDGIFRKPQQMTRDLLRKDFPYDDRNGILTAIEFALDANNESETEKEKRNKRKEAAITLGFESSEEADKMAELAKTLKQSGETADNLIAKYAVKPVFPVRQSPNPERRAEHIGNEIREAETKTYEKRERSVRVSVSQSDPEIYLKDQYTNNDGVMVCQICHDEMPFKKKNREYYFECRLCPYNGVK